MKKIIILLVGIAAIIGLTVLAINVMGSKGSSVETELIDFGIKDIESVDKISLSDDYGQSFTLIKKDGQWTDVDGNCVVKESVEFLLDAFEKIEFKGYLMENSVQHYTDMMTAKHTKVEIFQNGEWTKTWFIGPPAPDHYGQIMLLNSAEYGQSDKPVIMKIKGVHGIIEPRFFADKRKWQCTNIFALSVDAIKSVDLKYNDEPSRSFTVKNDNNKFSVYQEGKLLPEANETMALRYLNNYKKINFDIPNYSFTKEQVDSLKQTVPFCVLTVTDKSNTKSRLRLFRIPSEEGNTNEFGVVVNHDMNRFWCELPDGQLVKCQYFHFNPILLGHIYFPMDLSKINTGNSALSEPEQFAH